MKKNKDIRAVKGTASHRNAADCMAESMTPEEFAKMKNIDIREADTGRMADILEKPIPLQAGRVCGQIKLCGYGRNADRPPEGVHRTRGSRRAVIGF